MGEVLAEEQKGFILGIGHLITLFSFLTTPSVLKLLIQ